jgi:hypothetical protein
MSMVVVEGVVCNKRCGQMILILGRGIWKSIHFNVDFKFHDSNANTMFHTWMISCFERKWQILVFNYVSHFLLFFILFTIWFDFSLALFLLQHWTSISHVSSHYIKLRKASNATLINMIIRAKVQHVRIEDKYYL